MVSQQNVNKRQRASAFTPYKSLARVAQGIYDLAEVLANAGRSERALAWQAVSSFAARALVLVGQSESLVPVLNLAPVAGKPVFVTHPPFAAAEATRKNELLSHAERIHVGMLSAHDANVDEMEATIRSGIIGEVTGLTVMGSESDDWDEMEALNIARRAHGANTHDTWKGGNDSNNKGCCIRKVPTLNGQVGQMMVHVYIRPCQYQTINYMGTLDKTYLGNTGMQIRWMRGNSV